MNRHAILTLLLLSASTQPGRLQAQTVTASDREGVRLAILDYVEGIYDVQPDRITRSVHRTLAKRGYQVPKDSTRYAEYGMTYEQLLNVARTFNRTKWIKPDAPKKVEIFEVQDQTATAKLTAVWGTDYFHLAKFDGKWMIVNVIWQSPMEEHPLFKKRDDSEPANDLAALSDEFSDAARLAEWKQHHEVEGWTNKLKRIDVNRTAPGMLYVEPYSSVWYFDYTAPFAFKEVEGDFMVTTRMRVSGTRHDYPQSTYSLAGLMVRRPRADAPYTVDEKWPKDREDYVFAVVGTTDDAGKPYLETKSAVRSRPLVKHFPLQLKGWLEVRVARVGPSLIVLYREPAGEWTVHERFYRPDLQGKVQVGVMAYSDFATIDAKYWYRPWEYNRMVIKDGKEDLRAEFDWVRFRRIAPSVEAKAMIAKAGIGWDDHRIDNDQLVRQLPFLRALEPAG